jgi:ubiquinone/menaquinone biosynthesis C-methylase UbiE
MPTAQQVTATSRHPADIAAKTAAKVFQEDWQTYRKMVDNNYLFHREAYDALRRILVAEMISPFRFLDVACGDASATVTALRGTRIAHYHGVDLSGPALDLARETLEVLPCPVTLERRDFVEALRDTDDRFEVVWIGLSLHHFLAPQKLELMRRVRDIVGETGRFLIYENASPGEETREAWMARWDLQRPHWHAYTPAEWETIAQHVHANDHPETDATWRALGAAAGFSRTRLIYACPTELFRLYCFQA